ncbi:MAG: DNA-binding protein YbiB [Hydrogenophaga sp.]|uniref:DNA-binding protein YbiB n=1 Tax=Hydrogenophaga sp. TaxID=1904254 RepID=UPI002725FCAF|nr:DNA-binding protein YbiB [Hydrogenophaga sp.]MDO9484349.1 DNA-binding protein YbiB [Hydrogenophaga sp.]MDP3344836.1 DNA-binding protein YbiB [Hydrogenophaga sp.]MDP3374017.1 DNA-binding protein YbiB [Hydrogenophaga sp.]MDP3807929.1 DNA-binding protein YbiB [Hydrogenophaga sp.]
MGISQYIKVIGRGKDGARALTREQAADLFGQVLDSTVTDLEVGGFCLAMRIKGETAEEMAGFLDATHTRLHRPPGNSNSLTTVVLPSYNGARKLPVLTPLLALLLARQGAAVLVHGTATEDRRATSEAVFAALGVHASRSLAPLAAGELAFVPTEVLCPGLKRLLDVRRVVGLRNPAHSLVKLMNPCAGRALIVGSYTHPEYAVSMADTFALTGTHALLLRGTEGEPVADARRTPQMEAFRDGQRHLLQAAQDGPLASLPDLPRDVDAASTAAYIQSVLDGERPVPGPIALQVEHILREVRCQSTTQTAETTATPEVSPP